ncbi:unnamed protein product, partial [Amoebophrya sp. A25]
GNSGKDKKFKQLREKIRKLTGGVVSKKSVRGAMLVVQDDLIAKAARGVHLRHGPRIMRETGKSVVDALREDGARVVSMVRTRWFAETITSFFWEKHGGLILEICQELETRILNGWDIRQVSSDESASLPTDLVAPAPVGSLDPDDRALGVEEEDSEPDEDVDPEKLLPQPVEIGDEIIRPELFDQVDCADAPS